MKLLHVFLKSLKEQTRDLLTLSLSLAFAPLMVVLYWFFFPSGGSTVYSVMVLNLDQPVATEHQAEFAAGQELIEALSSLTYADGSPLLKIKAVSDRIEAEKGLRNRDAAALLIFPEGLSQTLYTSIQGGHPTPTSVTFVGDLTNPYYAVAAVMSHAAMDEYLQEATGEFRPVQVTEEALGGSAARSEFEVYVPGLLVFATIMLVFQASMSIAREVESGTLRRLQISRMTSADMLGGVSLTIILLGMIGVLLTYLTALALDFRSHGPLWLAILVSLVSMVSIVGTGLIVACFSRTVNQAFIIANFPLAIFMFFSNAVFPIPKVRLFTLGSRTIGLYDFLPATHAVAALNKVLTLGAGLREILFELSALILLSGMTFAIGIWLFQRIHLRT